MQNFFLQKFSAPQSVDCATNLAHISNMQNHKSNAFLKSVTEFILNLISHYADFFLFISIFLIFFWDSLPNILKSYLIKTFNELSSYQTAENFKVPQFELDIFVRC
ncbi:hypothetical protein RclHR1_25740003 [Rhizophagus clarus]|uniref:Uncharacterized protein n=1 Tax=Rhizophagus clarus TaxID=94130 RepID=A0A2Z6RUG0_9GLOM|nr:hypothetical protein RclHR1_25740003 [Rhizophagus clarus]